MIQTYLALEYEVDAVFYYWECVLPWVSGQAVSYLFVDLRKGPGWVAIVSTFRIDVGCSELWCYWDIAISKVFKTDPTCAGLSRDQSADDLNLIIVANIEVSLHPLKNLILQLRTLNLEHNLEWEPLQECKLLPVIIAVLKDWNPNLQSVIGVLAINFIQAETIVHALLHKANVLVVSDFKPVV